VFSYNLGTLTFKIIMQLVPVLIISYLLFDLLPPFSMEMMLYFILSTVLGYLVLYSLNFIVWVSTFWFFGTFSLVTIKDAAVLIFSGALVPLWFMPQWLVRFIKMTPFDSIFSTPIQIYLGLIPEELIIESILKQVIWGIVLFGIGHLLWKRGIKKLVVQGG
jgi:ABC-2 type transport system permease protein